MAAEDSRRLSSHALTVSPHGDMPTPISGIDAPVSKKRPTPTREDGEAVQEPPAKRMRVEDTGLQSPPPEEVITAVLDTTPSFSDEPAQIIRRAATLVLEHVGFDGASKEALEELCCEAESYMTRFLSYITESMLVSRRTQPTPLDFQYALKREGLTARLLRPHLRTPVPPLKIRPNFIISPQQNVDRKPVARLVSEELSGDSEKHSKLYIPKRFPSFPNKHTFRYTEVKPERETDPRKIREKATEEARLGEEALRRLVNVGKAGDHKAVDSLATGTPTKHRIRNQLWEKTMTDLAVRKPQIGTSFGGPDGDDLRSILVNSETKYGRKPVTWKRKDTERD